MLQLLRVLHVGLSIATATASLPAWSGAQAVRPQLNRPTTIEGVWSAPANGLRARFVVTGGTDTLGRPQLQITLELENVREPAAPIDLLAFRPLNEKVLTLTLEDEGGRALPLLGLGGSEVGGPVWMTIAARSTSRTPMHGGYEYARSSPPRVLLRPSAFVAWDITADTRQLYLRGTFAPLVSPDTARRGWTGSLILPRVALPPR